jgi:molybdopterin converting factor small subunit
LAKVKLKVVGLPEKTDILQESTMDAENIQEIIQHVESKYPPDYYSYTIFLNGTSIDDKKRKLIDGDEVVVIPIMSGG